MGTRTVIINGDQSWKFRALLWSQGLDLFPVSSGVMLRDCAPTNPLKVDYRKLLGNFPDDFSSDPFTLVDEAKEHVLRLTRDPNERLCFAVVLSIDDLTKLVAPERKAGSSTASEPAQAAAKALSAVIDAVTAQTEQENDRASLMTRVWLTIVVRDGGDSYKHVRLAEAAVNYFGTTKCRVSNVFFLSNGRGADTGPGATERQFFKLRLLIDVLRDDQAFDLLRRRQTDLSQIPVGLWLKLDDADTRKPSTSTELRHALVKQSSLLLSEVAARTEPEAVATFELFAKDIETCLPDLAGKAYSAQTAMDALKNGIQKQQTQKAIDARDQATLATRDIDEIIEEFKPDRSQPILWSDNGKRRAAWANLLGGFEAALRELRETCASVTSQTIDEERRRARDRQDALAAQLRDIRLPTGQQGDIAVGVLRDRLESLEAKARQTNKTALATRERVKQNIDSEDALRKRAFAVLDQAEAQFLEWSTLWRGVCVLLWFLAPVGAVIFARFAAGIFAPTQGFGDAIKIGGPLLGLFVLSLVLLVFAAAYLHFGIVARWRRIVSHVRDRLTLTHEWLREEHATELLVDCNRHRLKAIRQVLLAITPNVPTDAADAAEQLTDRLQTGDDVPDRERAAQGATLTPVRDAIEAFKRQANWQRRYADFLAAADTVDRTEMRISFPSQWAQEKTFGTTAVLTPITLHLHEAGHVA